MDISAFLGVLRRGALIILVTAIATAAVAYLISTGQETKYSAATDLLLEEKVPGQPGTEFSPPSPEEASDRESLVRSGDVVRRAEEILSRQVEPGAAKGLVRGVEAASAPDSSIVTLTSTTSDPTEAALVVNALAQANIDLRRSSTLGKLLRAERAARRELEGLGSATPENASATNVLNTQLVDLRQQIETNDGDARIVKRATPPTSPSSPKPKRNAAVAAFGGLLLGLALALVREQVDRRVRHSKDLGEAFGLPVLASVPKSRALAGSNGTALEQLPPGDAEAFQLLRANLHYLNTDQELRSVVVTSTGVGDGKSTVALNLAKADAIVGKKVLLIEADVRRPQLAGLLGLASGEGLTAFLADPSKPLADVTTRVPVGRQRDGAGAPNTLDVVIAGQVPDNPSELINSDRMRDLIKEAEADYDLVVLDTPPATMVADSIPLMSEATAVIIVGRVGRITSAEADGLRQQLERIGAPAYGLVANFAAGPGKYGYGYY